MIDLDVGSRIVELRNKKKMSTNGLANKAGISQSYLRDVELGITNPTVEKIEYICEALDISLKDFFDTDNVDDNVECILSRLSEKQKEALIEFLKTIK